MAFACYAGRREPDLPFSWYTDVLRELRVRHPSIDLDCFSPIEIQGMSRSWIEHRRVLRALKEAGMHGLPGGGAEMLVEGVRRDVSPKKAGQNNGFESCVKRSPSTSSPAPPTCLDLARAPWSGLSTLSACVTCRMRPSRVVSARLHRSSRGRSNLRRIPSVDGTEDRTVWNLVLDRRNTFVMWPLLVSCSTWSITSKHRGLRWGRCGADGLLGGADDIGSTMMEENVVLHQGPPKFRPANGAPTFDPTCGLTPRRRNSRTSCSIPHTVRARTLGPVPALA